MKQKIVSAWIFFPICPKTELDIEKLLVRILVFIKK